MELKVIQNVQNSYLKKSRKTNFDIFLLPNFDNISSKKKAKK